MSTRATCLHCGQTILRRSSDGAWFGQGIGVPVTGDCNESPNGLHAPASTAADDRLTSAYSSALVGAARAATILSQGHGHAAGEREKLAKAAESLNAYLAELER